MRWWLMKTEPDVFGIADLARLGTSSWDGVRNYQARNFMQAMALGDRVLIYHSNAKPSGVAGLAEVCRTAHPDRSALDPASPYHDPKATPDKPIWQMVDVRFVETFARFIPLDELRADRRLAAMLLFSRSRLSVQPVDEPHAAAIVALGRGRRPRG